MAREDGFSGEMKMAIAQTPRLSEPKREIREELWIGTVLDRHLTGPLPAFFLGRCRPNNARN